MPHAQDFLCDLCGDFTSLQANPFTVMLHLDQPGDRVGTSYDMAQVVPFVAFVSAMRIPRFEACDLCCFVGLKAADGSRTLPPVFTVDLNAVLLAYFQRHGASLEYPGLSADDVARRQREEAQAAGVPGTAVASPAVPVFLPELPPGDPAP